ncbi:MAG TPA: YciI family protein [Actinomycetota bacterium]|nr:YciI family protein [Actinomycetota bacterium]
MTRYLLSVYQPDGPVPEPEVLDRIMADLEALNTDLRAAGAWVFAAGLHPPSTATVVRSRDGEVLMTDGPYTEGKEHVGGFTVVDAPDLDAALGWAARLAEATSLPIEVRPFLGDPGD